MRPVTALRFAHIPRFTRSPNGSLFHSGLVTALFRFLVRGVFAAVAAVLAEFQPLRRLLLVLRRAVVAALTFAASHRDDVSHGAILNTLFDDLRNRSRADRAAA